MPPPAAHGRPARLAYVVACSQQRDEWRRFAAEVLATEIRTAPGGALHLRMDGKLFRFAIEPGEEGDVLAGWEFDHAADLETAVERVRCAGLQVTEAARQACSARGVQRLFGFTDPAGNPVELCLGHLDGEAPTFRRPLSGFKTGDFGLGHMVYTCPDIAPLVDFYRETLGFRLSDSAEEPFAATFLHLNPRHHSLAFVQTPRTGVHHVMVELYSFDDVGQAYDRAQLEDGMVGATLGRHTNDFMTSFYAFTPSGFMIEVGWGGRDIDPDRWTPEVLHHGPSLWGHERQWLQGPQRQLARDMRLRAADTGRKAPMQVADGFFEITAGAAKPIRHEGLD